MAEYFVSPTGNSGNPGTLASPWDLASAVTGHSGTIQPGDTIWLRGGTYARTTVLDVTTVGQLGSGPDSADGKIIFKRYQNELPIIELTVSADPTSAGAITVNGAQGAGLTTLSLNKATNPQAVVDGNFLDIASGPAAGRYKITADATIASPGPTSVNITPGLRGTGTAGGEIVTLTMMNTTPPDIFHFHTASYTWFWGLEIRAVMPCRSPWKGGPAAVWFQDSGDAGASDSNGNKVLHCVIHDVENGPYISAKVGRAELYGNVIYNVGLAYTPGGHGFYVGHQGTTDRLNMEGNVIFNVYNLCTQMYHNTGNQDFEEGIDFRNNILFNAGALCTTPGTGGVDATLLEIGGQSETMNSVNVEDNAGFQPNGTGDRMIEVGQGGAARIGANVVVQRNYMIGGGNNSGFGAVYIHNIVGVGGSLKFRDNFFRPDIASVPGNNYEVWITDSVYSAYDWGNNTFYGGNAGSFAKTPAHTFATFTQWKNDTGFSTDLNPAVPSTGAVVKFYVTTKYEPRGIVCYYNWGNLGSIPFDPSALLAVNDQYEIRDVRDPHGAAPVLSGTYTGGNLNLPNTQLANPTVSGGNPGIGTERNAPTTAPFFNAFIVVVTGHQPIPPQGAGSEKRNKGSFQSLSSSGSSGF